MIYKEIWGSRANPNKLAEICFLKQIKLNLKKFMILHVIYFHGRASGGPWGGHGP